MLLANKVAVVLPGTFGVGHDAAVRFAVEGARVVVGGADEENGRKTLAAIARAGGAPGEFVACDLLKEEDVERVVKRAIERHGALDVAFGCPDYYLPGLIVNQSASDFDYSLHFNCRSLFFLAKHAIPYMASRAGGSVIFLSSVYGLVSGSSSCAYEVAKGTVMAMTRSFADRHGAARVRVNCIAAGHLAEEVRDLKNELPNYMVRESPEVLRLSQYYPLGRLGVSDDIARAAVYLGSDMAEFVTGTTLQVEGGFVCR